MAKADYKAYLQSIQVGEVDPIKRIKNYLEELSERDEALKTLYRPEKINDCYNFIRDCVKSIGKGNAYCIEDAVVFKMARDYFIDILPKEADEPPEVKSQAQAEETAESEETEAETPPETTGVDIENSGSSNPREAEPQDTASDPVHYDENGNGLLFDFE